MQKDNLIETSKLIFNCLSEYYSIFGSKKKMLSLITKELQNKSGETYKSIKKCIKKYLYIRMYVCMYACICTSAKINKDK